MEMCCSGSLSLKMLQITFESTFWQSRGFLGKGTYVTSGEEERIPSWTSQEREVTLLLNVGVTRDFIQMTD